MSENRIEVPTLAAMAAAGKEAEILFWVGCAGSFDERAKKITKAFVKILHNAGVSFAVLGAEETCSGDPSKRAGNEFLYFENKISANPTTIEPTIDILKYPAPLAIPIAIAQNIKTISILSLIAVLNLTIDNAPTNPNDRAKDDFTIDITSITVTAISTNVWVNFFLFDKEFPYFE